MRTYLRSARYREAVAVGEAIQSIPGFESFLSRAELTMALWRSRMRLALHERNEKLGIPQSYAPNPACGQRSLLAVAQHFRPSTTWPEVQAVTYASGLGSRIEDLRRGALALGFEAEVVSAPWDAMAKVAPPYIAFVEDDRFVAVQKVDRSGVTYQCAHCCEDGMPVHVNWKAWRAMIPSAYLIVREPSVFAAKLEGATSGFALSPDGASRLLTSQMSLLGTVPATTHASCAGGYYSNHQEPWKNQPHDGDPVNLATLEQEFSSGPDLVVYNPVGPQVVFQRTYQSLLDDLGGQNSNANNRSWVDFGRHWTTGFDHLIADSSVFHIPQSAPAVACVAYSRGEEAMGAGKTWEILNGSTILADSNAPAGWTVSRSSSSATITPPAGGAAAQNLKVRWSTSAPVKYLWARFDVQPANTITRDYPLQLTSSGSEAPSTTGGGTTWDIVLGASVVATSAATNGWSLTVVSNPIGQYKVQAPVGASLGSTYKFRVRYYSGSTAITKSGPFALVAERIELASGTKTMILPNGARLSCTAGAVPVAGNPVVSCSVPAGTPYAVNWCYDSANQYGYYTVNAVGGEVWVYSPVPKQAPEGSGTWVNYVRTRVVDALGHYVSFAYGSPTGYTGAIPVLTQISNQDGQVLLTVQRAAGATPYITSITDCYGRQVSYGRSNSRVSQVSQIVASGTSNPPMREQYGYLNQALVSEQLLSSITTPSPTGSGLATTSFEYNLSTGLVTAQVDPIGNRREYTQVNATTTKVTVKNPGGTVVNQLQITLDSRWNVLTRTDGSGSTNLITYTYANLNAPDRPSAIADGAGRTTQYAYDAKGNITSITNAKGTTTTSTWDYSQDPLGRLASLQVGSRPATTYSYQASGLLQGTSGVVGGGIIGSSSQTTDAMGNLLSITIPGNAASPTQTETFSSTTDGAYSQAAKVRQLITHTFPDGRTEHMRYDSQGRLIQKWDWVGRTWDFTYNLAGQITDAYAPPTGQSGAGRVHIVRTYDFPGSPLRSEAIYDESATLVQTTQYGYDALGRTTSTNTNGATSNSIYDADGRLASVTDSAGRTQSYTYNARGFLASITRPGSQVTTYDSYGADGKLTQMTDSAGRVFTYTYGDANGLVTAINCASDASVNSTLAYDSYDRVTSMATGDCTETYGYDDADEITSKVVSCAGMAGSQIFGASYAPDGSLTALTTSVGAFNWTYDGYGRLTTMQNPSGETTQWAFDAQSRISQQTLGNGAKSIYTYDLGDRANSVSNQTSGGQVISAFTAGPVSGRDDWASITASIPNYTAYAGTTNYTYDTRDRLTQEASTRAGGYTNTYGYDSASNLTTIRGATTSFDAKNQITNGGYVYDGAGNPTQYGGTSISWNARNKPATIGTTTFGYKADGRRCWKQVGANRTFLIYWGNQPILECNASGTVTAVNSFGSIGLVSRREGGATTYYLFDLQGSPCERLNASQTVLEHHVFDAYGVRSSSGATSDPYVCLGSQLGARVDSETGYVWMSTRLYDPVKGRFISRDELGEEGGENLYLYADGNPANLDDPMGWSASGVGPNGQCFPTRGVWVPDQGIHGPLDLLDPSRFVLISPEFERGCSNFCAGFGDSASFGLSEGVRRAMNDGDDLVDHDSGAYFAGEATEMAFEIAMTAGAAYTKNAAKSLAEAGLKDSVKGADAAARKSLRRAFTREGEDVVGKELHHINPTFGHPGRKKALFPLAGLSKTFRNGRWNIAIVGLEEHGKLHRRLIVAENILGRLIHPGTQVVRVVGNGLRHTYSN